MSAPVTYTKTQIALHWVIAALVAFQILAHQGIQSLWIQRLRGEIPDEPSFQLHALVGIAIGLLVLWRLWLRFAKGVPEAPESEHPVLRLTAAGVHVLFYILLLLMAASGLAAWFGGIREAGLVHSVSEKLLLVLIFVHVLAALAHQFVFRTNVLRRMLGMS